MSFYEENLNYYSIVKLNFICIENHNSQNIGERKNNGIKVCILMMNHHLISLVHFNPNIEKLDNVNLGKSKSLGTQPPYFWV